MVTASHKCSYINKGVHSYHLTVRVYRGLGLEGWANVPLWYPREQRLREE